MCVCYCKVIILLLAVEGRNNDHLSVFKYCFTAHVQLLLCINALLDLALFAVVLRIFTIYIMDIDYHYN